METQLVRREKINYITARDCASVLFQHRKLVSWSFLLLVGATLAFVIFRTPSYSSEMTILVNLERTSPLVSSDPSLVQKTIPGITAEEVNSEIALLQSRDLLQEVVIASGLNSVNNSSTVKRWLRKLTFAKPIPADVATAKAVAALQGQLVVGLIPKSTLIRVSYSSPDRERSAKVLASLGDLYLKKHLAVRRPAGTVDFFKQEAERSYAELGTAQKNLQEFARLNHVPSVVDEKQATVKKLTELQAARGDTQANIQVTSQRIRTLEEQMSKASSRLTTQVRKTYSRTPDQIQSALFTLELKRTELLGIFQPDYPAVKEIDKQIAEAKAAITESQERAAVEETTDRDPAYDWLRGEFEKSKVELAGLQARRQAVDRNIAQLGQEAARLSSLENHYSDLDRSAKLAEAAYVTYQKKQEEARVSEALDRQRILNVSIAEKPSVPILPSNLPATIVLLTGILCAVAVSSGLALGAERINPSFRTPQQVQKLLDVPVVISLPEHRL